MFAFTSMGDKIQKNVNQGKGPYVYRIHGQNYHMIGSLLLVDRSLPKFAQLYVYVADNKVNNKMNAIRYIYLLITIVVI